ATVRVAGRAQAIDRLGRDRDGGVEAERVIGAAEIVVDGLGQTDHRYTAVRQQPAHCLRAVAADEHERIDAVIGHFRTDNSDVGIAPPLRRERLYAARAENDAAERRETAHGAAIERDELALVKASPSVDES